MALTRALLICLLCLGCTGPEAPAPEPEPAKAPAVEPKPIEPKPIEPKPVEPKPTAEPAPDAPAAPAPPPETAPKVKPAPGFAPHRPAVRDLPLAARLPDDALGVVALGPPSAVAARIGWLDLVGALDADMAEQRAAMTRALGHDLVDPAQWAKVGLDADAPIGFAVLSITPPTFAIGAGVTDPGRLSAWLREVTAGEVAVDETQTDGVTELRLGPVTVALKDKQLWAVLGDGLVPGESLHHARRLARPDRILLERADAAPVIGRLDYGRDLAAYVHIPGVIDAAIRAVIGVGPDLRVERELNAARALGDEKAVATLTARLTEMRAQAFDDRVGGMTLALMLRSYLTPFGGVALGLQFEADAVQLRMEHALSAGSAPARVFRARPGRLELRDALPRRPAILAEATVDLVAIYELVRTVSLPLVGANVTSAFEAEVKALAGVDFQSELLPMLAGDMGAAMGVDPARAGQIEDEEDALAHLDLVGHVGLADPEGMGRVLAHLAGAAQGEITREGDRYSVRFDDPLVITWEIVDHQLRIGNGQTLSSWKTGPGFPPSVAPPALADMLTGASGGWVGWLDFAALGPAVQPYRSYWNPNAPAPPGVDAAALEIIQAKIEDARRRHRDEEVRRSRALLKAVGTLGTVVDRTPDGIAVRAGLYVGGGETKAALLESVRLVVAAEDATRRLWSETLRPLYKQRDALRRPSPQPEGEP